MKYIHPLFIISLLLLYPMVNMAQKTLPICTSMADIKAHSGQRVLVFGHRATHHGLPHQPYVLLLERNEWIFLGSERFYQGREYQTSYILIEGVVEETNQGFELAKFTTKHSFPRLMSTPVKEPEKVIRNHPVFTKVYQITGLPICNTKEDLNNNLGSWILVCGFFSKGRKKSNRQTLHFQSNRKKPITQFEVSTQGNQFKKKLQPGMVIARFNKLNAPPTKILFWQTIPYCTSKAELAKHLGEVIAVSGRIVSKGRRNHSFPFLKTARKTYIYFSYYPKSMQTAQANQSKKLFIIASVQNKAMFFDFNPSVFLPGYTATYFSSIYWYDY